MSYEYILNLGFMALVCCLPIACRCYRTGETPPMLFWVVAVVALAAVWMSGIVLNNAQA